MTAARTDTKVAAVLAARIARSERHRHLLAGRGAVRLRDVLGDAVHLPADGGDPGDQRTHRPGDRAGHRRQHPHALLALAALAIVGLLLVANIINLGADLGAMGGGAEPADRRPGRPLCRRLRHRLRLAGDVLPLRALCLLLKWISFVCWPMWRWRWWCDVPWGLVAATHLRPDFLAGHRLRRHHRRGAGHHDHAVLLLLAILAGGRGRARSIPPRTPLLDAPEQAPAEIGADAVRYLCRDGLLERDQPVHHRHHRGDA